MRVAVLSGKGGTGKTFVAVNLAAAAGEAVYVDCDVEEPNGGLFFKPESCTEERVYTLKPEFDAARCTGCRKCVDFCEFNALIYIRNKPVVFPEICHSCGGCALFCPEGAVSEKKHPAGTVRRGRYKRIDVVTGILDPGEASGVPVIREALKAGFACGGETVIDCPPGSGCSVMESVSASDACIIVAEPTAFGFHNFKMVHELVSLMDKPCFVIINKEDEPYGDLEEFCALHRTPVLRHIPYSPHIARLTAGAEIACEADRDCLEMFDGLLRAVRGEAGR